MPISYYELRDLARKSGKKISRLQQRIVTGYHAILFLCPLFCFHCIWAFDKNIMGINLLFNDAVAQSHFNAQAESATIILYHQPVSAVSIPAPGPQKVYDTLLI